MSFLGFVLLQAAAGALYKGNFTNPYSGDFRLAWLVDDENQTITFHIDVAIRGWVGIGFSTTTNNHVSFLDFYAGVFNDSNKQFSIVDGYALSVTQIYRDSVNNVINGQMTRDGGITSVSFTRMLDTTDINDTPITNQIFNLIWCYHSDDVGFASQAKHDYYGSAQVNFFDGTIVSPGTNMGPRRTNVVVCDAVIIALNGTYTYKNVKPFFTNLLAAAEIPTWRALIFDLSDVDASFPLVDGPHDLATARGAYLSILLLPDFRTPLNGSLLSLPSSRQLTFDIANALMNVSTTLALAGQPAFGNTSQVLVQCYDEQERPFYWRSFPCPDNSTDPDASDISNTSNVSDTSNASHTPNPSDISNASTSPVSGLFSVLISVLFVMCTTIQGTQE